MAAIPLQIPKPETAKRADTPTKQPPMRAGPAEGAVSWDTRARDPTQGLRRSAVVARPEAEQATAARRMAAKLGTRLREPMGDAPRSPEQEAAAELEARRLAPLVAAGDRAAVLASGIGPAPPAEPGAAGAEPPPGLGSGQPMPEDLREGFEQTLRTDLDDIRLHTDSAAQAAATNRGAKAFAHGRHLVFGRGRYRPEDPEGRQRLAHELVHGVQQRGERPRVQADPDDVISSGLGAVSSTVWPKLGMIGVSLNGEPWVTVRWDVKPGLNPPKFMLEESNYGEGYGCGAEAPYGLRVTVNRGAEQNYADIRTTKTAFAHRYLARGAQVEINEHLPAGSVSHAVGDWSDYKEYPPGKEPELFLNPEGMPYQKPPLVKRYHRPFNWQFDNLAQLKVFVAANPSFYWAEYALPGKKPTALHLDESGMQQVADKWRRDTGYGLTGIYEHGRRWPSMDPLAELFYSADFSARYGMSGDSPECLVFSHGKASYGRKPLGHHEALAAWIGLERGGIFGARNQPVRRGWLQFLSVRGSSGALYRIDSGYLQARAAFFRLVAEKEAAQAANLLGLDLYGPDWDQILDHRQKGVGSIWLQYLRAAIDRPENLIDPELARIIDSHEGLAGAAGKRIMERAEWRARTLVLQGIQANMDAVARFTSEEGAKSLILQLPFMSTKERRDALTLIGAPEVVQPALSAVLGDRERALQAWIGEAGQENGFPELIQFFASAHHGELKNAYTQVDFGEVEPLHSEGELGEEIRRRVYKEMGFNLSPRGYPHETLGEHRKRARYPSDVSAYGSEMAFLYAHATAERASREQLKKYALITAAVVASVVLVLVANAAGAAVAGLLFAEATAGFIVAEVVVSAAIVTAVGPGLNTLIMSGGTAGLEDYSAAYDNLGEQYFWNVVTFGFFKALGAGTRALAIRGAGSSQALAASRGWRAAEVGMRVGASGTAMFAINALSHYAQNGKLPEGETLHEMLYETGLSLLLLEVGGHMAKPRMRDIQRWAKGKRLGKLAARMETLEVKVNALNRDIAALGARPHAVKGEGGSLLKRQTSLLKEQQAVLLKLQSRLRTRSDARAMRSRVGLELEAVRVRLQALKEMQFLSDAEVRPAARRGEKQEFVYKRGHEKQIKEFYGEKNVTEVDGHLRVSFEGKTLVFRPVTNLEAGILPDGTRSPKALDAWRVHTVDRQMRLMTRADALGANTKGLKEVARGKPREMTDKQLKSFEGKLKAAERYVTGLEKKGLSTKAPSTVPRPSEAAEAWQTRLVDARGRLIAQAELLLAGAPKSAVETAVLKSRLDYVKGRLRTGRKGLKANTLENHRLAIDKLAKAVEDVRAIRNKAMAVARGRPKLPEVDALKPALEARQQDILRRAKLYGSTGSQYIKVVSRARLRIGQRGSIEALREAEALLEKAEARLDVRAKKELAKALALHGKEAIAEARLGELADLTDAQVGDAMRAMNKGGKLSANSLRGLIHASRPPPEGSGRTPIPLDKLAKRGAKDPAALEFVLGTYGRLREAQVSGSFDVLRDAVGSSEKWVGGVWQLELARNIVGLEKVAGFEVKEGGRVVDIKLTDGSRIEAKDWTTWYPEKVDGQFYQGLENATKGGTNPQGIRSIRWLWRQFPVRQATIRNHMKATLERFITEKGLDPAQAGKLRRAFDKHAGLNEVPEISRLKVTRPPPKTPRAAPYLPPQKDDDKKPLPAPMP